MIASLVLAPALLVADVWLPCANFPVAVYGNYAGACMAAASSNALYAVRGELGDHGAYVYNYTPAADAWSFVTGSYHNAGQGSDMALQPGGALFSISGGNQRWSGTINPLADIAQSAGALGADNSWPAAVMGGGGLVSDMDGRYAYVSSGQGAWGAATGSTFMRCDLSNGTWTTVRVLQHPTNQLYTGGGIVGAANLIFLLHGTNDTAGCLLFAYNQDTGEITARAALPETPGEGLSFVYDGGANLIGTPGGGSSNVWFYDLRSNTWQQGDALPQPVGRGGGMTWDAQGQRLYVLCGGNSAAFYARAWTPTRADLLPPRAPTLIAPPDGEYLDTTQPSFSWYPAEERGGGTVVGYTIMIDGAAYATPTTNFTPGASLSYGGHTWKVNAIDSSGLTSAWSATRAFTISSAPLYPDFCCVCIERFPKCNRYQVWYAGTRPYLKPGTEGDQRWPLPGETITYIGYIYNGGTQGGTCEFVWRTNGVEFSRGSIYVARDGFVSNVIAFAWPAGAETHAGAFDISLQLNPTNAVVELSTTNNWISESTRALALSYFMAREYFDALALKRNRWGTSNAVDWLRIQFEDMQRKFEQSVHAATPSGILERVRIDRLVLAPNAQMDALLSSDPYANGNDGRWQTTGTDPAGYANTFGTTVDYGLIHEVGHQLGLIDIYQYDVEGASTLVQRDGAPLLVEHIASQQCMMRTHGNIPFSEFSALAMNSQLGRRRGYYGDFQFLIPRTNIIAVLGTRSNALAGATIECFRRGSDGYFSNAYRVALGTTDAAGQFVLPVSGGGYSTSNGYTLYAHPFDFLSVVGGNILLLKVSHAGAAYYSWFECIAANIAYWRGASNTAVHTIYSKLAVDPATHPAPANVHCRITGTTVTLTWAPPVPAPAGYIVYGSGNQPYDAPLSRITTAGAAATNISFTRGTWRFACLAAVHGDGVESSLTPLLFIPDLPAYSASASYERYIAGITLLPDGHRLVCLRNSEHEEPVWQRTDGSFAGMWSSVHNHFIPYDAAYDARLDRVIVTDLPDGYSTQHCVAVLTRDGRAVTIRPTDPRHMFGSYGTGDGQFDTPTGVAVDSQSRILVADRKNNRVQAFTASGDFIAKYTGLNAPQDVDVDGADYILVTDTGNKRIVVLRWSGTSLVLDHVVSNAAFSTPVALAHGDNSELFVADAGLQGVLCFSADHLWGTNVFVPTDGSGSTLQTPRGLACMSNNVVVVGDSGRRRVVTIAVGPVVPEPAVLLWLVGVGCGMLFCR
jgi:hypothetical protein